MKTLITLAISTMILFGCSSKNIDKDNQSTNYIPYIPAGTPSLALEINEYRNQYSHAVFNLLSNTNELNRLALSNTVEQLKQDNLHLFNIKK